MRIDLFNACAGTFCFIAGISALFAAMTGVDHPAVTVTLWAAMAVGVCAAVRRQRAATSVEGAKR